MNLSMQFCFAFLEINALAMKLKSTFSEELRSNRKDSITKML